MKRIFVALPISEKLQAEILAWEQEFQHLPVRWLKGKNLHVTLIPPWEESEVNKVIEALRQLGKPPLSPLLTKDSNAGQGRLRGRSPIELKFDRVTFGPNPREPRLIWAEGPTPQQIPYLITQLQRLLNSNGQRQSASSPHWSAPERPFKLHLTLARFRPHEFHLISEKLRETAKPRTESHDIQELNKLLSGTGVSWRDTAASFVLMESHLIPTGADYEILQSFPL